MAQWLSIRTSNQKVLGLTPVGQLGFSFFRVCLCHWLKKYIYHSDLKLLKSLFCITLISIHYAALYPAVNVKQSAFKVNENRSPYITANVTSVERSPVLSSRGHLHKAPTIAFSLYVSVRLVRIPNVKFVFCWYLYKSAKRSTCIQRSVSPSLRLTVL